MIRAQTQQILASIRPIVRSTQRPYMGGLGVTTAGPPRRKPQAWQEKSYSRFNRLLSAVSRMTLVTVVVVRPGFLFLPSSPGGRSPDRLQISLLRPDKSVPIDQVTGQTRLMPYLFNPVEARVLVSRGW